MQTILVSREELHTIYKDVANGGTSGRRKAIRGLQNILIDNPIEPNEETTSDIIGHHFSINKRIRELRDLVKSIEARVCDLEESKPILPNSVSSSSVDWKHDVFGRCAICGKNLTANHRCKGASL